MRQTFVAVGSVLFLLAGLAIGDVNEDGDWQAWLTISASHKAGDWRFKIEEEVYAGDDAGDVYYRHTDLRVARTVPGASWLELGLGFREIQEENSKGEWLEEYRPRLSAEMKFAPGGWYLRGRSWLELRCKTYSEEKLRFRERVLMGPPAQWFAGFQPYIGDEIFVQEEDGLNKNRIYAGIEKKIWKLKAKLEYLLESKNPEEDDPDDVNVLHAEFEIEL